MILNAGPLPPPSPPPSPSPPSPPSPPLSPPPPPPSPPLSPPPPPPQSANCLPTAESGTYACISNYNLGGYSVTYPSCEACTEKGLVYAWTYARASLWTAAMVQTLFSGVSKTCTLPTGTGPWGQGPSCGWGEIVVSEPGGYQSGGVCPTPGDCTPTGTSCSPCYPDGGCLNTCTSGPDWFIESSTCPGSSSGTKGNYPPGGGSHASSHALVIG